MQDGKPHTRPSENTFGERDEEPVWGDAERNRGMGNPYGQGMPALPNPLRDSIVPQNERSTTSGRYSGHIGGRPASSQLRADGSGFTTDWGAPCQRSPSYATRVRGTPSGCWAVSTRSCCRATTPTARPPSSSSRSRKERVRRPTYIPVR